jgi:hypothetical protein
MDVDVHGLIAFDWGAGVHTVTVPLLDLVGLSVGE